MLTFGVAAMPGRPRLKARPARTPDRRPGAAGTDDGPLRAARFVLAAQLMTRLSLSALRAIVRAVAIAAPPTLSLACGGQTVGSGDDSRGAAGTSGTGAGSTSPGAAYHQQSKTTQVPLRVECYAPDAGASDVDSATDGGDGGAEGDAGVTCTTPSCEEQCGATLAADTPIYMFHLVSCALPKAGSTSAMVTCEWQSPPAGRRPSDLRAPAAVEACDEVGAYLAASAFLEEASIGAFLDLERNLRAHGAPDSLVRRARGAARDEARHTRTLGALARGAGATPPRPERRVDTVREVEAIAIENAVEGCVREAYGALVALWQSERAGDPAIRSAMAEIAVEEAGHAELAVDAGTWMKTQLDEDACARVERAMHTAVRALQTELAASPPAALIVTLGVPTPAQAHLLVDALAQWLFRA